MDSHGRHLLVIEDDPAVADGLRQGLAQEGFTVSWRNSGREGVAFAQRHNPHLVIPDVRLPDGSGFDFCRQMRRRGSSNRS